MQKLYYAGIAGLVLFEILNVYFIMPMPGSQEMRSIDVAYFLYSWRWVFRSVFGLLILGGILQAFRFQKWVAIPFLLLATIVTYAFNFKMTADHMFLQPQTLRMKKAAENKIPTYKLVICVAKNGEARAYPIQLIGYHHQVLDKIAGQAIMVTYCTVCRTGRIFEPLVNGKPETFRLVGMDHFNAMFEDHTTKSWWRQVSGEAIAGKLKGEALPEVFSQQMTLAEWLKLYPNSLIMQPDQVFKEEYDDMKKYDKGKGKSSLTKTDTLSWKKKSWVVGVVIGKESKAFDWNRLKKDKTINDEVAGTPIVIALAADTASFFVFERPNSSLQFRIHHDTLTAGNQHFDLLGDPLGDNQASAPKLKKVKAYQEFWHSWQTFHPNTVR
jgi:hypothetical protein